MTSLLHLSQAGPRFYGLFASESVFTLYGVRVTQLDADIEVTLYRRWPHLSHLCRSHSHVVSFTARSLPTVSTIHM